MSDHSPISAAQAAVPVDTTPEKKTDGELIATQSAPREMSMFRSPLALASAQAQYFKRRAAKAERLLASIANRRDICPSCRMPAFVATLERTTLTTDTPSTPGQNGDTSIPQ
jgi:hypothetical protein